MIVLLALHSHGAGVAGAATREELSSPYVEAAHLSATAGADDAHFGFAVAADGDTLAIGARDATVTARRQGAVYVYVRDGTGVWSRQARLIAPGGRERVADQFGAAVALEGDTLIVGAPGAATNDGAVFEFRRTGAVWAQTSRTSSPAGAHGNERFGASVALSGSTFVAGAPTHDLERSGAAYPFVRAGDGWALQGRRLTAPRPERGSAFGTAVAIDGDRLLAGAPGSGSRRASAGEAHVFTRDDGAWVETQALTAPPRRRAADRFGAAVAIAGDELVVGAPGGRRDVGDAYPFTFTAGLWVAGSALSPAADRRSGTEFGAAVAIQAGTLAVGAPRTAGSERGQGAAFVYAGGQGAWALGQKLTASGTSAGARLGAAVAVDGADVVAGIPYDDTSGDAEGSAWLATQLRAEDDTFTATQDLPLRVPAPGVLANDVRPGGEPITAVRASEPAHGSVTVGPDGSFDYRPDPGFSGADAFTYRSQFGETSSNVASVVITVGPVPTALPDRYRGDQGNPLVIDAASGVLANDTSGSGLALSAALAEAPAHGTVDLATDGAFTYTPAAGYSGTDRFTYRASDAVASSPPTLVTIDVVPRPPPVAVDDSYAASQDTPLTVTVPVGVLANDVSAGGLTLTASVVTAPAHGRVVLADDGAFTYVPDAGFSGADAFVYRASDANGADEASVAIAVLPPEPLPPVAIDDDYATGQDTSFTVAAPVGVLANDTSPGGTALTAALAQPPAHGNVTLDATGAFVYQPDAGFHGIDAFTYDATDGAGTSRATATITVAPAPPPPVAVDDAYDAHENTPLTIGAATGVLANDVSPSGAALAASVIVGPANGTLTLQADGSFTYTPNGGYSGPDSFVYEATDSAGTDQASVAITVRPTPLPPVAVDDAYSTDEDAPLAIVAAEGVLANDTSPGGAELTAQLVTGPAAGTLTLGDDGAFVYTPPSGFSGNVTFLYAADDGLATDQAMVTIAVVPATSPGTPPAALDDAYTAEQDTTLAISAPAGVLANDTGDPATAAVVAEPTHGTLVLDADGSFTYAPSAGYSGPDTFRYSATNAAGTDEATVTLDVRAVRPPPVGTDDAYVTRENQTLVVGAAASVLANDTGDGLTATVVGGPAHGTLTLDADGSFTYVPDAGFSGQDAFVYAATNAAGSDQATATITVRPSPPPPVAAADRYSADEGTPLAVAAATGVLANDEGAGLTATLVATPSHGSVVLVADGAFTYVPDAGYAGPDSFRYAAVNGSGADEAVVSIMVLPQQLPPAAVDDRYAADEGTPLVVPAATGVLANDVSPSGAALAASVVSGPSDGTLVLLADGSFAYTPAPGFSGVDRFVYAASDGLGADQAVVEITVQAAPPPPVAVDDAYSANQDAVLTVAPAAGVLANDTGPRLAAAVVSGPAHGTLDLAPDGAFRYAPTPGFRGEDRFVYAAGNPFGTAQATAIITVLPKPNRPPVAGPNAFRTPANTSLTIPASAVSENDFDPDGDPLSFASPLPVLQPRHGVVVVRARHAIYTPDPGFVGRDSFTYAVTDGQDNSAPATVSIEVTAPRGPDAGGGTDVVVDPGGEAEVPIADVPVGVESCRVLVDVTVTRGRVVRRPVVASGTQRTDGRRAAMVGLDASNAGVDRLRRVAIGGVPANLRVICRTSGGHLVGLVERRVALLEVQRVVSPPGSWVGDRAVPTAAGQVFLRDVRRDLRSLNVATLRCAGHAANAPGLHPAPVPLSRRRAAVACAVLRASDVADQVGLFAHGNDQPIASNATEAGRRVNRRVAITVTLAR